MIPITVILHDVWTIKYHKIADEVSIHVTDKIPIMNVNIFFIISRPFCINNKLKIEIIEECVKSSPEFDEYLFNNWDRIKAQKSAEYERDLAIGDAIRQGADVKTAFRNGEQNIPKCPTCGSTNIQKISTTRRLVTTGLFGLASSNVGKTMLCKNCGYKW